MPEVKKLTKTMDFEAILRFRCVKTIHGDTRMKKSSELDAGLQDRTIEDEDE